MGEFNFAEELKKMPQTPGVYLMHDAHDDVIYVGKAVNLKRRVSSYFRKSTKRTTKIESMVSKIRTDGDTYFQVRIYCDGFRAGSACSGM